MQGCWEAFLWYQPGLCQCMFEEVGHPGQVHHVAHALVLRNMGRLHSTVIVLNRSTGAQVTCRRLLADFDSDHDGVLDDDELTALLLFLMPCLSTAECRTLLRTELPPLLPGSSVGVGSGARGTPKPKAALRPLALSDFQQLLTLDSTILITQVRTVRHGERR